MGPCVPCRSCCRLRWAHGHSQCTLHPISLNTLGLMHPHLCTYTQPRVCLQTLTPRKSCTWACVSHTALSHREPDAGSFTPLSLSLLCAFPHVGFFSSAQKPQPIQATCLRPTSGQVKDRHVALSCPPRSRWPALLRLLPTGSWEAKRAGPGPGDRERKGPHGSEGEESSFHLREIKL